MDKHRYFATRARLERHLACNWDDVESWLVYGDLLQERGDPRGELIAIERAILGTPSDDGLTQRREALRRRLLAGVADAPNLWVSWHWGAVRQVAVSGQRREGERLVGVPLAEMLGKVARLACTCMLESVSLTLTEYPRDDLERALVVARRPTVRQLTVSPQSYSHGREVRCALNNSQRQLAGITSLELAGCHIGRRGARVLGRSRHLRSLEHLGLAKNDLDAVAVAELLEARIPWALRSLALGDNRIGDDGVAVLCGIPPLAVLRTLDLRNTGISDDGASLLSRCDRLPALETLLLGGNTLTPAGWAALRRSTVLGERVKQSLSGDATGA